MTAGADTDFTASYLVGAGPPVEPEPEPGPGPKADLQPAPKADPKTGTRMPLAPELDRHPAARTTATTARFEFSSPEPGVGFACQLDKGQLKPCGSPRAYRKLKAGRHVFRVYAEAPGEDLLYSPAAAYRWRVVAAR